MIWRIVVALVGRARRMRSLESASARRAVTTPWRFPALPDRPAVAEALPGFVVAGWEASRRRQNFPPRYSRGCTPTMVGILDQPDIPERIRRGRLGTGGNSPEEFRHYMLAELVKWAKLVKESGAKLD